MVFDAFAKGDKTTLKQLLSDERYQEFSDALDHRLKDENRTESTLVSTKANEITHAVLGKKYRTLKRYVRQ